MNLIAKKKNHPFSLIKSRVQHKVQILLGYRTEDDLHSKTVSSW